MTNPLHKQTAAELRQLTQDVANLQSETHRIYRRVVAMRGFVYPDEARDDVYQLADHLLLQLYSTVGAHLTIAEARSGITQDGDQWLQAFCESLPALYKNFRLKVVRPDDDGPKAA
jgi:hypothetical protein